MTITIIAIMETLEKMSIYNFIAIQVIVIEVRLLIFQNLMFMIIEAITFKGRLKMITQKLF